MNGSSLVPTMVSVHQPIPDDREPKLRPKMFFFDRIKVFILLAIYIALCTSEQKTQIPLMTWGEALRDQLRAKWWVLILFGLEFIRQIHNIISEHNAGYNAFWQKKVFGGWERRMSKMKPYSRFRWSRLMKRLAFLFVSVRSCRGCGGSGRCRPSPRHPRGSSATSSSTPHWACPWA